MEISKKFITLRQAAEKSGMSVGWWRHQALAGKIEAQKIGNVTVIPKTTVERVINTWNLKPRQRRRCANCGRALQGS
jgi:hypothetical protein